MSNLNSVTLQGNLVADPQIVGDENRVARFSIAVNNGFGENQDTTFADCVAFGKQVQTIEQYLTKGRQVIVNGTLRLNRWTNSDGENRSRLEVHLNNFDGFFFCGSNPNASESENSGASTEETVAAAADNSGDSELF
jgi:single-strand DNA-binding protein